MNNCKRGKVVRVTVTSIVKYGVFVMWDNYVGMIHISELANFYVSDIFKFFNIGDKIYAKIINIDTKKGYINLSTKHINYKSLHYQTVKRIQETKTGFKSLAYNLPIWVDQYLKNQKNSLNCIDKLHIK